MGTVLVKIIGLWAFLALPVSAAVVDATAIILIHEDCRASCLVRPNDGGSSFSLSYTSHRKGPRTYINLQLGDYMFQDLRIYPDYIEDGRPPFYKYVFPNHIMFGLVSTQSAYNSYEHYFMRGNNTFNYLGRFPTLKYDTERDRFVGSQKTNGRITRYYYRLENDRLVEDEDY